MDQRQWLFRWASLAALYLFWPGVLLVTWGELTPHMPAWTQLFWDKSLHFTAYFGLAAMATLTLGFSRRLLFALVALAAFGGLLEVLQGFTGRDPDIHDEIVNVIGLVIGFLIARVFTVVMRPRVLVGEEGGR